jgi:hypothetical protein
MAYNLTLTDSTGTDTLALTEVPLTTTPLEIATDVQVLSGNLYTDFVAQKRIWSHTWAYLSEDEYNVIKGYYDRQFTLYEYPQLTIDDEGVDLVTVRMSITPKNIIDDCGNVQDVTVSFRETGQLGS